MLQQGERMPHDYAAVAFGSGSGTRIHGIGVVLGVAITSRRGRSSDHATRRMIRAMLPHLRSTFAHLPCVP